ncbi:MAG TPA: DUF4142 domain-containing protein [Chitinophagaceae bacterium]
MIRFQKRVIVALAVSAIMVSCNSDEADQTSDNREPGNTDTIGTGATNNNNLDNADADFLSEAAYSGLREIEAGKAAQSRAGSNEVRELAKTMVTDHTAMGEKVKSLAARKNVALKDSLSAEDRDIIQNNKKKGKAFDREYTEMMVDDHERAVRRFESAANTSRDPEVKALATEALPKLREHLEMSRRVRDKVKG